MLRTRLWVKTQRNGETRDMRIEPRKSLWKKKRLVVVEKGENFEIVRPMEVKPLEQQLDLFFRRRKKWE